MALPAQSVCQVGVCSIIAALCSVVVDAAKNHWLRMVGICSVVEHGPVTVALRTQRYVRTHDTTPANKIEAKGSPGRSQEPREKPRRCFDISPLDQWCESICRQAQQAPPMNESANRNLENTHSRSSLVWSNKCVLK